MKCPDHYIYGHITPVLRKFFHDKGWVPNMVTTLRLLLTIIIICCIQKKVFIAVPIILVICNYILDCVDGDMARTYNQTSKIGAWYDGTVDILLVLYIFYMLIVKGWTAIPRPLYITMIIVIIIFMWHCRIITLLNSMKINQLDLILCYFNPIIVYPIAIIILYHYVKI